MTGYLRPCIVHGVYFPSITAAARAYGVPYHEIAGPLYRREPGFLFVDLLVQETTAVALAA